MKVKKHKVLTLVGTRPEIIKLSRVIDVLDQNCEHILVHSGQNYDYELNEIFFEDMQIRKPNNFLNIDQTSPLKAISDVIEKLDDLLDEVKPDSFLVLGDTNSAYGAIAAKKKQIPIFHMEAGNRCFDLRVPEEINRKLVDHISDINMPYTDLAREYLISEGFRKDHIVKTGSPMKEVLDYFSSNIESSNILEKLKLEKNKYFVISCHREENLDYEDNFIQFIKVLETIEDNYNFPILVSTHPRLAKKMESVSKDLNENIVFCKPFGFTDYISLMMNSRCVLSDSGTITEESSIMNFKAINIRDTHERPEGSEIGVCIFTGLNVENVKRALNYLDSVESKPLNIVKDYNVNNVSEVVLKTILSYSSHVNKFSWRK